MKTQPNNITKKFFKQVGLILAGIVIALICMMALVQEIKSDSKAASTLKTTTLTSANVGLNWVVKSFKF